MMIRFVYRVLLLTALVAVACSASWLSYRWSLSGKQHTDTLIPRFIKVDKTGEHLSLNSGPWHCVYDTNTKLLWMVGRDDESPFDSYWSYSWYIDELEIGVPDRGSCYFAAEGCSTHDLIAKAKELALCNSTRWRLPTSQELLTLVQPPLKAGGAAINHVFFPHTKKGDYWTNSHSQPINTAALRYLQVGAEAVSFKSGEVKVLPYRTAAYVKLVSNTK